LKIVQVYIKNFRGIKEGKILLPDHGVLVGDNNVGKSTVLEAIDLVLSPDRLRRRPVIDEHDFFAGDYLDKDGEPIKIEIEVILADLNEDQQRRFYEQVKFWDTDNNRLLHNSPQDLTPESTDRDGILPAIHVVFEGIYDKEEDDFTGKTYFQSAKNEEDEDINKFLTSHKRTCGFFLLGTDRTTTRTMSLDRGSLLCRMLNLENIKFNMWEQILAKVRKIRVDDCDDEASGIDDISSKKNNSYNNMRGLLARIHEGIRLLVPSHWGSKPEMRVSDLTRKSLRRAITFFMETGVKNRNNDKHLAPFKKQGAGTANMLLFSMLSMIVERKQNVILAMEEPETAVPPYTQKSIVNMIKKNAKQTIVTSHSPFVLEDYIDSEIVVLAKDSNSKLSSIPFEFPAKKNTYRKEVRQKYCEALLAKRVLIVEGKTEYDAIPVVARRLQDIDPDNFSSLESLGIAVIDAEGDGKIPKISLELKKLGKEVFAIYDKQENADKEKEIRKNVDHPFASPEKGFETLVVHNTEEKIIREFFSKSIVFDTSNWKEEIIDHISKKKGYGCVADLLVMCKKHEEMPKFITRALSEIKRIVESESAVLSADENNSLDRQ